MSMDIKYWLELPLVIGLGMRAFSDFVAGGFAHAVYDGDAWPDIDRDKSYIRMGARLQSQPLAGNPEFPGGVYYLHAATLGYFAIVSQEVMVNLISYPGLVFGALGVPPAVMKIVAYGNVLVMYWYAGGYLARGVKATVTT